MNQRFQFQVFPSSGLPIYRQLIDQVRSQVSSGRLKVGDMLPSVRSVAQELAVNPMTISKAYSELEREGVVERVRGFGMRIAAPKNRLGLPARKSQLRPYLQQAAAIAYQLSLTRQDVLEVFAPLLERLPTNDTAEAAKT